jgi:transcriptional regulator with XRE-family HTH domain
VEETLFRRQEVNSSKDNEDEQERRRMGEKLREAREYIGFSQDDVSAFLKIPRTAVTNIESGQRKVEALELKRLAELFRQPVGFFTDEAASAVSLPPDVALLARQAAKLSVKDRQELGRFAEFLKSRSKSGAK